MMKLIKETRKVKGTYAVGEDIFCEIIEREKEGVRCWEAWLYAGEIGYKSFIVGINADNASYDEFIEIVGDQINEWGAEEYFYDMNLLEGWRCMDENIEEVMEKDPEATVSTIVNCWHCLKERLETFMKTEECDECDCCEDCDGCGEYDDCDDDCDDEEDEEAECELDILGCLHLLPPGTKLVIEFGEKDGRDR